jgi:hypothetical protein
MSWVVTFLATFAMDICWALCVASVKQGSPFEAGGWAVLLFLFGAVGILGYTQDRWLLIPGAAGSFARTALGVAWAH